MTFENAKLAKEALLRATGMGVGKDGDEWIVKVNLDSDPVPDSVRVVFENVGVVTAGRDREER